MSDADCTPGLEPRNVAASYYYYMYGVHLCVTADTGDGQESPELVRAKFFFRDLFLVCRLWYSRICAEKGR